MATTKMLELPCGLEETGGVVSREIEIRKLKGRVQRELAKLQQRKRPDAAVMLDTILQPSIVSLNGTPPDLMRLRRMLLADRDWLLFELRKHTWGSFVTAKQKCEECDLIYTYPGIDLDDLKIIRLGDDTPWWDGEKAIDGAEVVKLQGEARAALGCRVFVLENDDLGCRAVFRFGNGNDQSSISKYADQQVKAVWRMMADTCLQWQDPDQSFDRPPKKGFKEDFWDEVDMDIVGWVQRAFADAQPGVETKIEITCEEGHDQEVTLNATDFFFPEVSAKRS